MGERGHARTGTARIGGVFHWAPNFEPQHNVTFGQSPAGCVALPGPTAGVPRIQGNDSGATWIRASPCLGLFPLGGGSLALDERALRLFLFLWRLGSTLSLHRPALAL